MGRGRPRNNKGNQPENNGSTKPPPGKAQVPTNTKNLGIGVVSMVTEKAITPTTTPPTDQRGQGDLGRTNLISIGKVATQVVADPSTSELRKQVIETQPTKVHSQETTTTTTEDHGQKPEAVKKWTNLFTENKLAMQGMDLTYVAPIIKDGTRVAQLMEKDIEKENEKWKKAIILYVVGNSPSIGALERFVAGR
ncbi:hypothetical protein P3L10_012629 [Capsicum annuum]